MSQLRKNRLGRLVLVRHGESIWNITDPKRGLTSRFTGWADIPLTDKGLHQAASAGRCLKVFGVKPHVAYTSLLQRSRVTFEEISKVLGHSMNNIPIINSWRLNERHYGSLVGLSKQEASTKMNEKDVVEWRRSWNVAPPKMSNRDLKKWSEASWAKPVTIITEPHKQSVAVYEKNAKLPETESLQDCADRVTPLWINSIIPRIKNGQTVLVVAHANSIRAMVRQIDKETMTDSHIRDVYIPSAIPLIYDFMINEETYQIQPLGEPTSIGMTGRYLMTKELMLSLPNFHQSHHSDIHIDTNTTTSTASSMRSKHSDVHMSPITTSTSTSTFHMNNSHTHTHLPTHTPTHTHIPMSAERKNLMIGNILLRSSQKRMNPMLDTYDYCLDDSHDDLYMKTSFHGLEYYDLIEKPISEAYRYADYTQHGKTDAIIITDDKGVILYVNEAWTDLCGFSLDEIKGKTNKFLQGPLTSSIRIQDLNNKIESGLPVKSKLINYRKNGVAFENDITIIPVYEWHNTHHPGHPCTSSDNVITTDTISTTTTTSTSNPSEQDNVNIMNTMSSISESYPITTGNTQIHTNIPSTTITTTNTTTNATMIDKNLGSIFQDTMSIRSKAPSYYIAKLEVTPNRYDLPPLTEEEMKQRNLNIIAAITGMQLTTTDNRHNDSYTEPDSQRVECIQDLESSPSYTPTGMESLTMNHASTPNTHSLLHKTTTSSSSNSSNSCSSSSHATQQQGHYESIRPILGNYCSLPVEMNTHDLHHYTTLINGLSSSSSSSTISLSSTSLSSSESITNSEDSLDKK